ESVEALQQSSSSVRKSRQTIAETPATPAAPAPVSDTHRARHTLVEGAAPSPPGTLMEALATDVDLPSSAVDYGVDTQPDGELALALRPPIPASWQAVTPDLGNDVMKLVGAGLGLYGLREVPMV